MEEVTGNTLRSYVGDPNLSYADKLEWLIAVASGLGAAHRAGLVHRDVKPENVMVTGDRIVKILDFGIARRSEDASTTETVTGGAPTNQPLLTARGVAIGTPQYMAPEQLHAERLDGRADQFSWGVMAWELFVGTLPWGASRTSAQIVAAVLAAPMRPLREASPSFDPIVSDVIARAVEKNREQRFATMEDLLEALHGKKVRAPAPSGTDVVALGATEAQPSVPRMTRDRPRTRSSDRPPPAAPMPHTTGAAAVSSRDPSRSPVATNPSSATRIEGARPREPEPRPRTARLVAATAVTLALVAGALVWGGARRTSPAAAATRDGGGGETSELMARADHEEREGRQDLACKHYREVADAEASNADAAFATVFTCATFEGAGGGYPANRPYYNRAWELRSSLTPVRVAVLDAYEPMFLRDPQDLREALARLEAAGKQFPGDAQIHNLLARGYSWFNDRREIDEFERSLALDGDQPHVLATESDHLAYYGDFDAARAAATRCLRRAATSLECLDELARIDGEFGACDAAESDARRMVAVDPKSAHAQQLLANALYAQGTAMPSLRAVLARKQEGLTGDERAAMVRADELSLAILGGDLANAEKLAREQASAAASSLVASDHGVAARVLATLEEELGQPAEASKAASEYLDGRDGWQADPRLDDWALAKEPTPLLLAVRARAGGSTREAYERDLARAIHRWEPRVEPGVRSFVWIYAYAEPAETARDGAFAVVALPAYEPLPPYKPESLADAAIGRALFLGGKTDLALVHLERATKSCFPLDHPIEHTRAHYFLGMAREAKHDLKGACDAYRVVSERWGHAKPRSTTAQAAGARIAALRCGS
jgi:serine/threonine-protein kinase